jgi:hypothetical protein
VICSRCRFAAREDSHEADRALGIFRLRGAADDRHRLLRHRDGAGQLRDDPGRSGPHRLLYRREPRIDAAREKLETALKEMVDPSLTHAQMRAVAGDEVMATPQRRAAAQAIMDRLLALRARCQRQTNSIVTPMGDEMFYRYQQALIDEAATTLAALLPRVRRP